MSEELKPCPFCGCPHIAVGRFLNYGRKLIQFHCPKCNAQSGVSEDEQRAIEHWNMRYNEGEQNGSDEN